MATDSSSRRRFRGLAAALVGAVALSGCVSDAPNPASVAAPEATYDVRMVEMRFDCEEGEVLLLAGNSNELLATDSQDTQIMLQASPPGQTARYDAQGHALVLHEREALWMKAGEPPMTCSR